MKTAAVLLTHSLTFSRDLIALAISDILSKAGIETRILRSMREIEKIDVDLWFILMDPLFLKKYASRIRSGIRIFMCDERIPYSMSTGVIEYDHISVDIHVRKTKVSDPVLQNHLVGIESQIGKTIDWIFEYNPHNDAYWHECNVNSVFCPMGYHEKFVFEERQNECPDIFCFARPRTKRRLSVEESLLDMSCEFCRNQDHRWKIGMAKVGLNVHLYDRFEIFPERRMSLYASNGLAIVSERCDWTPFSDDEWVECEYDRIQENCFSVLHGEYGDIGKRSLAKYKNGFRFADHLKGSLAYAGIL